MAHDALRLCEWLVVVLSRRRARFLPSGALRARRPLLARESGNLREGL